MALKRTSRLRLAAALVIIILSLAFRGMLSPVGGSRKEIVRVPRGATAGTVGRLLAGHRMVRSALGFKILARLTGKSGSLKPGAYDLNSDMSPMKIIDKIASGDACSRWLTVPEGYTAAQIGDSIQESGMGKAARFTTLALRDGYAFKEGFPHPKDSLEGYLFPDTYLMPVGASEDTVIREMLACFDRKVAKPLAPDFARSDMSFQEIITLASLIEREARVPKDRPMISAVLRNRLRVNMRLQCDATVIYALGHHVDRVLYRDLEIDSPYNTYRNAGLPPGPIANPGLDSIKAALHPAEADYLYYVAKPDGSHIFSRTLDEHQRAKAIARGKGAE